MLSDCDMSSSSSSDEESPMKAMRSPTHIVGESEDDDVNDMLNKPNVNIPIALNLDSNCYK